MSKTAALPLLCALVCAAVAQADPLPRRMWLAERASPDSLRTYDLCLNDHADVIAVDASVLIPGPGRAVQVRTDVGPSSFMKIWNMVGDTLKIALARARGDTGSGPLLRILVADSVSADPPPRLITAKLNGGNLPLEFEALPRAAGAEAFRAGDFNGDGSIDLTDFFLFADHFGRVDTDPDFDARYDLDRDGAVDLADFFLFADVFGT